jgi:hypothetical protein
MNFTFVGNKEATGRIAKRATEMAPFTLKLITRSAIKSQLLVDFLAEWQTPTHLIKEKKRKVPP